MMCAELRVTILKLIFVVTRLALILRIVRWARGVKWQVMVRNTLIGARASKSKKKESLIFVVHREPKTTMSKSWFFRHGVATM